MKLTKKKVFVTALALSLVAILSVGTLAWFQAADQVDNYFQVTTGGIGGGADFSLDLFEHKVVDGALTAEEVEENTYKEIAPGATLPKDPTLRNDGEYDQWVRVKITLDEYAKWEAALGSKYEFQKCFKNFNAAWKLDETTKGTGTLVFYYQNKLTPGQESKLFDAFMVPGEFTVENMPTDFKLTIVGEAIQADNTGATAEEAFTLWK